MQKLNIAFDLDEVLVDVMSHFKRIAKIHGYDTKTPIRYGLANNPQFSTPTMSKTTVDYIWSQVYEAYWMIKPYEAVPELLETLHKKSGDPIKIITNRPVYAASPTYYLMDTFCKVPYEIAFTNGWSKLTYLNGIKFFVEDRRKIALELAENDKTVFMPKKSWNKLNVTHPEIHEISEITEILNLDVQKRLFK